MKLVLCPLGVRNLNLVLPPLGCEDPDPNPAPAGLPGNRIQFCARWAARNLNLILRPLGCQDPDPNPAPAGLPRIII